MMSLILSIVVSPLESLHSRAMPELDAGSRKRARPIRARFAESWREYAGVALESPHSRIAPEYRSLARCVLFWWRQEDTHHEMQRSYEQERRDVERAGQRSESCARDGRD